MCHLYIEKALKSLYARKFKENSPKIHDLNYLKEKIGLKIPEELSVFLEDLNDLSVPTRYPDEIKSFCKSIKKKELKMF